MPTPEQIAQLFRAHRSREATEERALRAALFDRERRWASPGDGYRLSDRLWRQKAWIRSQIDDLLVEAIRTGEDALVTARKVEQFLDPAFAPTRTERGRIVRGQRRGIVTEAPGRAGGGSLPARTLARTEISRAHAQGTLFATARTPFAIGVRWALSASHPRADECSDFAGRNTGLGVGVYRVSEAPRMPAHPNCLCRFEPVTVDDVDAVVDELKRLYRL